MNSWAKMANDAGSRSEATTKIATKWTPNEKTIPIDLYFFSWFFYTTSRVLHANIREKFNKNSNKLYIHRYLVGIEAKQTIWLQWLVVSVLSWRPWSASTSSSFYLLLTYSLDAIICSDRQIFRKQHTNSISRIFPIDYTKVQVYAHTHTHTT